MNYLAHGVLAARESPEPSFVLAAMVPDFAGAAGLRIDRSGASQVVVAGLHHHATADEAFHGADWFRQLCRVARDAIGDEVPRGARVGGAHIMVELLLDRVLVDAGEPFAMWDGAWSTEAVLAVEAAVPIERRGEWRVALDRWRRHGHPRPHETPDDIAGRVTRILRHRPRLQPGDGADAAFARAAQAVAERLGSWDATWLDAVGAAVQPASG